MARVPTAQTLSGPRLSGGRAPRAIPNIDVPQNFDVPVADLPDRVSVPQVNLPTPDIPNAVPVSNDVNIGVPDIPGTLYTASDINALEGPGRAIADLGGTVTTLANRWGEHLQALEMGKAKFAMVKGLTQLDSEVAEDPDYTTHSERYVQGAARVKADAMGHLTTSAGQEQFSTAFDLDVLQSGERIKKEARAKDVDAGRAELMTLLKTNREKLNTPGLSAHRRKVLIESSAEAIAQMYAKGYIDAEDAQKRKDGFNSDVALDDQSQKIADGKYDEAREDVAGGKALAGLRRAPEDVQQGLALAAERSGVSAVWLAEIANAESSFDPAAKNPNSSATGLYQFTDDTWISALRQTGRSYRKELAAAGIPDMSKLSREEMLALRRNPMLQSIVMAEHTFANITTLEERLGGQHIGLKDAYLAHVLGAQGAVKLLNTLATDPEASAEALFAKEAAANPRFFAGKTVAEAYQAITSRVGDGNPSFAYEALDGPTRLSLKNRADQEEYQSRTQRDAATQVRKAQIETLVKDDEQSIETTGIGVDNLDVGEIGDVLGPERAAEHAQRRETALAKYEAKQGLESLTDEEIAARVDALAPQPGMDGYAAQRDIHETVSKRAAEIADLREKDPALAVEQTPEVQSALAEIDALNAEQQQAGAPGVTTGAPEQIGKIARARMAAQERIGIEEAPLTRRESKALLSRVIKTDPSKTDQGWIEVINDVEATYGRELGKKVLATALGYELKEDKDEAPIIANWIGKVARGEGITDQDLAQFHEMRALKASQGFMNNYSSARFDSPAMTALGVARFEESEAGTPRTPGMRGASKGLPRQPIPKAAREALKLYPDRADEFMRKYGLTREEIEKIIAK